MEQSPCQNCHAENAEGSRFCNRCGKRLIDDYFDAELEARLLGRLEEKLKEKWLSKQAVEKDIALKAASQLADWLKLLALPLSVAAAIGIATLAFYGIRSTSDLSTVAKEAASLKITAQNLQAEYKPLEEELPRLKRSSQ